MFLALSKIIWAILQPLTLILGLGCAALLAASLRRARLAIGCGGAALALFVCMAYLPLGPWLLASLENKGRAWVMAQPSPASATGVLLLGGFSSHLVSVPHSRGPDIPVDLTPAADRLTVFVAQARRYSDARLYVSGGRPVLAGADTETEAGQTLALLRSIGFDGINRLTLEPTARSTRENALALKQLVQPKAGERWILVTSLWHLPRVKLAFEQAGWPAGTLYPVIADQRISQDATAYWKLSPLEKLAHAHTALREYLGLLAYEFWAPSKN